MKTLKYILSASISLVFLTACNDSFLEKYPETELNEEAFFQTPEDMAIYLNNSYKDLPYGSDDLYSDNIGGYTASHEVYSMLHGTINENTVGGWSKDEDKDWYNLRKANVLLVNAHKVKGEQTDIDHYIGVARFFRANFYFKMLKRYGAAPWYDHPLSTNDPDLYKGMDSRELIADKIMEDLEFAAKNIKANESLPTVAKLDYGYLPQLKYYPRTAELNSGYDAGYNDIVIFRYAETLLINAEAKAELGTIKQEDLNATVNLLRKRVGMPDLKLDVATDPKLTVQYPAVTGTLANVILEIRRERRVELACEGLRYDDLMRWKAGKLLEGPAEGVYIPAFGAYDVTGDGENDIAILESPDKTAGLTEDELSKLQKTYYLVDKDGKKGNIYLSEGNKGNIRFTIDQGNPPRFDETKYYYFPIPFSEIQLNPNLEQPSGWR